MDQQAQPRRRNHLPITIAVVVVLACIATLPWACRDRIEPDRRYPTAAAARSADDAGEWVPSFLPPSATDIHERHGVGRRFVRFSADSATLAAMSATMPRIDTAEVKRIPLPTPGWSEWWPISPRTLQSGQGKQIRVHRVDDPRDRGYVAIDPRTLHAFYWSVPARATPAE
ncbi:MAG TPA: hypothetical protein VF647_14130 [Longimicrobium sp.]|jgi:hypothetical protein